MSAKGLLRLVALTSVVASDTPPAGDSGARQQQLLSACRELASAPTVESDSPCSLYLRGFLDGAEVTDRAIIENLRKSDERVSSFLERAYRTRLGTSPSNVPATDFAEFCLPEGVTQADVIGRVVRALESAPGDRDLKTEVLRVLRETYPCRT